MSPTDPFARWGALVYRRRKLILVSWLVVLAVCGVFAPKAADVLKTTGIDAPESDSGVAARILSEEFTVSALNNVVVVFRSEGMKVENDRYKREVEQAAERVEQAEGVTEVATYYDSRLEQLVSKDRHTTIMFAGLKGDQGETQTYVDGVRDALDGVKLEHYVTGNPAILRDFTKTSEEDLRRAEVFTFAIVLLLLLIAFRTVVSAAVPLMLGAASVVSATAVIYLIGKVTDTSIFALNVASMIGLGLAIDFSLIVASRFREELAAGRDPERASAVTMATAGRSIVFSGAIVALGMLVLTLVVDLVGVRSISLGVLLVAVTAVLAGVTLLPAVLGLLGHRLERWRVIPKPKPRPEVDREGFWYRFSRTIMRRPWTWLLASLALLLVLAWPATDMKLLGSTAEILPARAESAKGVAILDEEFGENVLSPIQIVLQTSKGGVFTPAFLKGLDKLTNSLAADPRAREVSSLATYEAAVPRDGRYEKLKPVHDFWPAPILTDLKPGELAKGFFVKHFIDVWVPELPQNPAFMGFGQFRFRGGETHQLRVTPALQVYLVLKGGVQVRAGGKLTLWRKKNFAKRDKGEEITPETTVTLAQGDQLVVPPQTAVRLGAAGGAPAEMIAVVTFNVRPGIQQQDNWLEGDPTSDPFRGIPRKVIGGGLAMTFPTGEAEIKLDEFRDDPHIRLPRHIHHGPEMIVVKEGTFTVFASPEMVVTGADGRVEEGAYDSPVPLRPGAKGVVQGFGVHRSWNFEDTYAKIWSLRFIDANKPDITLVGVREIAKSFVNLDGGSDTAVINVVPRFDPYDERQQAFITDIRELIIPSVAGLGDAKAYVGGPTANFVDFHDDLYGKFPYLVGAVLLLTFLLLMMFFRSVFLPLKAILLNLCSILATFGVLTLIFQHGWGSSLFGFTPLDSVAVITPAILFVILFSLSTDYEVFLLSRVKEYYDETRDNQEAVARGLQHTGGVITAAGLILIGVFGSFATAGIVTIKEIGLGLAIGILIDTVLVRTIMVPATMRLAGDINWWMPAWLQRFVPELREGPAPERRLPPTAAAATGMEDKQPE